MRRRAGWPILCITLLSAACVWAGAAGARVASDRHADSPVSAAADAGVESDAGGDPWVIARSAFAFGESAPVLPAPPARGSALASASGMIDDGALLAARGMGQRRERPKKPKPEAGETPTNPSSESAGPRVFSGRRVRLMLQSLTVPGWGEATLRDRRGARAFALLEIGVWGSFAAFRIQEAMRQRTYERTAALFAGIDLRGRDDEFRRVVGFYRSSDDYNRLVVRRDAANLYFDDPAAEAAYVAAHELTGDQTWSWDNDASLLRYQSERQAAQRSIKRVHDALAAAVVNRLLSMIHASAGALRKDVGRTSWKVECGPAGGDPRALRLGLRADF